MAKPYSQDLRNRVIDAVRTGKMSRRAAARHYAVSEFVAVKWLERVERQGSREPVGHVRVSSWIQLGSSRGRLTPPSGFRSVRFSSSGRPAGAFRPTCDRSLPRPFSRKAIAGNRDDRTHLRGFPIPAASG